MALVLSDRVLETCTSPGTGAVTLLGAATGFQPFSTGVGNGNTCYYCIADQGGSRWEVGLGTFSTTPDTLTRTTPLAGSSSTPVDFNSGNQNVFVTYPAEKKVILDASGNVTALGTVSSGTWQGTAVGVAYGGTGVTTSTGSGSVVLNTSPSLVTPDLGTPSAATLTNASGLPLTTGVSGVLPTANGGTNLSSFTSGAALYATSTTALTTGTLPVSGGGTGQTSYTDGQLLIGNSTGNTLAKATLTAGTGIGVTNGSGSITIANTGVTAYPGSGLAVSTGSAWGTSKTAPSGDVVGTTDTQTLSGKTITGTKETVYTITDGAAFEIDPANGGIQTVTLGASRTPAATNFVAGQSVTLMVDDGSAYTITWTTVNPTWVGGSAPTLATSGYTVLEFWKVGSTIYGAYVGTVA